MKKLSELVNAFVGFLPKSGIKSIVERAAIKYEQTDGTDSERVSAATAGAALEILEGTSLGNKIKQRERYQKNRDKIEKKLAEAINDAIESQLP